MKSNIVMTQKQKNFKVNSHKNDLLYLAILQFAPWWLSLYFYTLLWYFALQATKSAKITFLFDCIWGCVK